MQAAQDSSAVNHLGQSDRRDDRPGGSIQEAGDDSVAAGGPAAPAGGDTILVGPVAALDSSRVAKRRHQLTARLRPGGDVVAVDTIDLARAGQRQRVHRAGPGEAGPRPSPRRRRWRTGWTRPCSSSPRPRRARRRPVTPRPTRPSSASSTDAGDPELNGLYTTMPPAQIANFDMQILEHVVVGDEDREESRLRLVIRRRGREQVVEMTAAEFASNGRLRTAVYGSALPGADLRAGADVLRRAVDRPERARRSGG